MILNHQKFFGRFIGQPICADQLFCNLPQKLKNKLENIRQLVKIPKDEIVFGVSDRPKNIFVLQKGQSQINFYNDLNQKGFLRRAEIGEILGFTQIFSNSFFESSLITLSPCIFEVYPIQTFVEILQNEPQLSFGFVSLLSMDIQASYQTFCNAKF